MIYFDNAATSFYKPPQVVGAAVSTIKNLSVNAGRGGHFMSLKGARLMTSAREKIAAFFGAIDASFVIFTPGCTAALNTALFGLNLAGKHVITTALEHNSVLRPLFELKRRGDISLTVINPKPDGTVDADMISECIRRSTALVVTTHVSNVTGAVLPIRQIGAMCRKNNLIYIVDAAQSAGLLAIDMARDNIDMLALPAHKGLHSLPGTGALIINDRVSLKPLFLGGTGTRSDSLLQPSSLPEGFEAGTVNLPGIAAMGRAVDLLNECFDERHGKVIALASQLYDMLYSLPGVKIYSPRLSPSGIITFNVKGMYSEDVCDALSCDFGICVRGGLHCAPLCHKALSTSDTGAVRASLSFSNTVGEIDSFYRAIKEISAK